MGLENFILTCEKDNESLRKDINYYKNYNKRLKKENQQLKEQLERSEKARKEAIKLVKNNQRKDEFVELNEWQARDLISILDIDKGE